MDPGPVAGTPGVNKGGHERDPPWRALLQEIKQQLGEQEVTEVADGSRQLQTVLRAPELPGHVGYPRVTGQTVEAVVLAGEAPGCLLAGVGPSASHDDVATLPHKLRRRFEADA